MPAHLRVRHPSFTRADHYTPGSPKFGALDNVIRYCFPLVAICRWHLHRIRIFVTDFLLPSIFIVVLCMNPRLMSVPSCILSFHYFSDSHHVYVFSVITLNDRFYAFGFTR